MRREIGRGFGEFLNLLGNVDIAPIQGQLATELMNFFQIKAERMTALEQQSLAQGVRSDEGIAIPIAADPASHAQERWQLQICPGRIHVGELILQGSVEARQFSKERVIVI
jgi:hypothetical protein